MLRVLHVFVSQWKNSSLKDFLGLLFKTIYLNDFYLIYMANTNSTNRFSDAAIYGLDIRKGEIDELSHEIEKLNKCPWEFKCHLHDSVDNFFIAKNCFGIQHISWIYSHKDHNRILDLLETDVEIKHCFSSVSIRGKGVYPATILLIRGYLSRFWIKRVFMCVKPENKSSIRGIEKAGLLLVGEGRFRKILGIQFSKRQKTSEINFDINDVS
jgi:RimJ/RimL family protein N-acetyltransferase